MLGWFLFCNDLQGCPLWLPIVSVCQFLPDSAHQSARNSPRSAHARKLAAEYFQRFPKERYREVESWRHLQSQNIEFTMKRLREPIEDGG